LTFNSSAFKTVSESEFGEQNMFVYLRSKYSLFVQYMISIHDSR